jgi:hypothetical protein
LIHRHPSHAILIQERTFVSSSHGQLRYLPGLLLLLLLASPNNVVIVVDRDTLGHVVDLVHTNQSRGQLEHVVAQGDDDELRVLGPLLDIVGYNRDLLFQ